MKTTIIFLIVLFAATAAHAETYEQCRGDVLQGIAEHEYQTGQPVTREDKRLSVARFCDHLRQAARPQPPQRPYPRIEVERRGRR